MFARNWLLNTDDKINIIYFSVMITAVSVGIN